MLVNPRSMSWYFSINLSHMFVLAFSWNLDGKQVGTSCSRCKGHNGLQQDANEKVCWEKYYSFRGWQVGALSFLRGIWPAGTSFKTVSQVLCIIMGGKSIPKICCLEQRCSWEMKPSLQHGAAWVWGLGGMKGSHFSASGYWSLRIPLEALPLPIMLSNPGNVTVFEMSLLHGPYCFWILHIVYCHYLTSSYNENKSTSEKI